MSQRHIRSTGAEASIRGRMPQSLPKHWARKKCPNPFAGNRPYGCFAQNGADTYFSLVPNFATRSPDTYFMDEADPIMEPKRIKLCCRQQRLTMQAASKSSVALLCMLAVVFSGCANLRDPADSNSVGAPAQSYPVPETHPLQSSATATADLSAVDTLQARPTAAPQIDSSGSAPVTAPATTDQQIQLVSDTGQSEGGGRYQARQFPNGSGWQGQLPSPSYTVPPSGNTSPYGTPQTIAPPGGTVQPNPRPGSGSAYASPPGYSSPPGPTVPPSYGSPPGYSSQPNGPAGSALGPPVASGPPSMPAPTPYPNAAPYSNLPPGMTGNEIFPPTPVAPPLPAVREADLVINGYPARTGRLMFGGAVNSSAGVTGQITIDERNFDITRFPRSFQDLVSGTAFRGAGQTLRVEAVPGSQFQRYTAQFADPNLLGYLPISMSVSGFLYDRRFDDWDEERAGGRLAFGYRITPDLSLSAGVSAQNVEISNLRIAGLPEFEEVRGDNDLYSGEISLRHDTRDSPIQPSQGHYLELTFEETFGSFDYAKFDTEYRTYFLLGQRADGSGKQTLSYALRAGFSGEETPIFENFFAGGYATMRGFEFRGASPTIAGVEVGGRFQFLNTVEYMFPLTADDAFRGVAFVDFGTVEREIEMDAEDFRVAPGVGLRVAIPMLGPAPLAFDFAFPVAKAATDEERIFSFYMSVIR